MYEEKEEKERMLNTKKRRGIIAYLPYLGNFGFISLEGRKEHLYFHERGLMKCGIEDLKEGTLVEFFIVEHDDKEKAISIEVIE